MSLLVVGVESGKYENLQKTLATIQEKLTAFIRAEETATKERIRSVVMATDIVDAPVPSPLKQLAIT